MCGTGTLGVLSACCGSRARRISFSKSMIKPDLTFQSQPLTSQYCDPSPPNWPPAVVSLSSDWLLPRRHCHIAGSYQRGASLVRPHLLSAERLLRVCLFVEIETKEFN